MAPFYGLGLLAVGLAAVIAWQIEAPPAPAPPPARVTASATPSDVQPQAAVGGRATELAAAVLARPLFSPERRPPAAGAVALPAAEGPLPRLTGILVTPEGSSAIFAGGAQPVVVRVGGRVGSFVVHAIEPGQVTLLGPDGPRSVRPSFDPGRPQAAAAPAALGLPQAPGGAPVFGAPMSGATPPGPSPSPPDVSKDAMPFEQKTTPTGLDIVRNQSGRAPGPAR